MPRTCRTSRGCPSHQNSTRMLISHTAPWSRNSTPWTTIFSLFYLFPLPLLYYRHSPFTRCLADCAPLLLPYLLHALPLPLLYYLCMHQYLLMCTLCAPFMPASPCCHLMYHCTFVHATRPPNMCNTMPLVHTLVV